MFFVNFMLSRRHVKLVLQHNLVKKEGCSFILLRVKPQHINTMSSDKFNHYSLLFCNLKSSLLFVSIFYLHFIHAACCTHSRLISFFYEFTQEIFLPNLRVKHRLSWIVPEWWNDYVISFTAAMHDTNQQIFA